MVEIEAPPYEFKLSVIGSDKPRTVFMSFGMLSELTSVVPDVDSLGQIHVDPEIRASVLRVLLSDRDEKGEISTEHTVYSMPMMPPDAISLLNWAHRHVAAYFMDALQNMSKTAGALQGVMETMMSSLPTTQDSASDTPAALPSE